MVETTTKYDPIKDETVVTYEVGQVKSSPAVSHATISWGGNCCVKSASYYGSAIEYGMDPTTCSYGVKFDNGFIDGMKSATHTVIFSGQQELVDGAGSVTVKGGIGFCTIPVKGVDCKKCTAGLPSPSVAPTVGTLTAPPQAETVFPEDAPSDFPSDTPSLTPPVISAPAPILPVVNAPPVANAPAANAPVATTACDPKNYPSGVCKMSGDPEKQTSCTPEFADTCAEGTWSASMVETTTKYDPIKDETVVTYEVEQVKSSPAVSRATISWGGNCCVKSASYYGSAIEYGMDPTTCSYGVKFDDGFSDDMKKASHTVIFSGRQELIAGAGSVTVKGGTGFCTIPVKGLHCDKCTVESPSPIAGILTAPPQAQTMSPSQSPSLNTQNAPVVNTPVVTPPPTEAPSLAPTTSASIHGLVLNDIDDLGSFSSTDTPLAGVVVDLILGGSVIVSTKTDDTGSYSFTGLTAGDYTVQESTVAGFSDVMDTDGDANGPNTIDISLTAGESSVLNNFLEIGFPYIEGLVLEDIDNNDKGDNPIAGVPVTLCKKDDSTDCVTTSTYSTGIFLFESVEPGEYCVVESNIGDYIDVGDSFGINDDELEGSVDDPNTVCILVVAGVDTTNIVFIDELPSGAPSSAPTISGSISGTVYLDNGDGDFSTGDSPIAGVEIVLQKDGSTVRTTATDITGAYSFNGLSGGDYTILEGVVADTTDVKDIDGDDNGPNTISVTLPAGDSSDSNDFLEAPPALLFIEGFVGYKLGIDTTGAFDGPIPNTLITLYKDGVVLKTTVTDADGNFSFTNLAADSGYKVVETQDEVMYPLDLFDSDGGGLGNLSSIGTFDLAGDLSFANGESLKFVDGAAFGGAARRGLSETKNLRGQY